jgi:hypothetical protein
VDPEPEPGSGALPFCAFFCSFSYRRLHWTLATSTESIIEHSTCEEKGGAEKKDIGRVGGWAADFDKLLRDPAGLQTFAEFLRKEFSHENIFFWCACERYRGLEGGAERWRLAQDIVRKAIQAKDT